MSLHEKVLTRGLGWNRFARTRRVRPEPLPRSVWGWIPKVLQYTQDDVVELAGYDAAMYLRILAFGVAPSAWNQLTTVLFGSF